MLQHLQSCVQLGAPDSSLYNGLRMPAMRLRHKDTDGVAAQSLSWEARNSLSGQSQKDTLHFYGYPTSILWGKKLRSESDLPVVTLQNMAALGSGRGENSS